MLAVEGRLLRELVSSALASLGVSKFLFGTGVEMLRQVRDFKPDLIFCEYEMSMVNGPDFVRHIRTTYNMQTPVVMLFPRTDGDAAGKSLKVGANSSLGIPFSVNDLLEVTKKVMTKGGDAQAGKIDWGRYS